MINPEALLEEIHRAEKELRDACREQVSRWQRLSDVLELEITVKRGQP